MRLLLIAMSLTLIVGCGGDSAPTVSARADSLRTPPFNTCALLTEDEWAALLGRKYYGPEQKDSWSASGETFTSRCTYNFAQVTLTQPATAGDVDDLQAELEKYLNGMAESDAEKGFEWTVHVEPVDGLGVPAVMGRAIDSEDPDGLGMYYLRALAGTGEERTLLEVASAEDNEQAKLIAARILAAL
jgi:hypothetical protein